MDKTTFEHLAQILLDDYRANGRRSLERVEAAVTHLRGFFGDYLAIDITSDQVTRYVTWRQKESAAPATINRELAALRRAFRLASRARKVVLQPEISLLREDEASRGSYPALADSLRKLVEDFKHDGAQLFRRMIFNMLVSNDDDHLRNHAVILDKSGWRLSAAYDLVPHAQGSYTRMQGIGVSSQSREANFKNALSEVARFGLTAPSATEIATGVRDRVARWETLFRKSGVPPKDIDALRTAFLPESVVASFKAFESLDPRSTIRLPRSNKVGPRG